MAETQTHWFPNKTFAALILGSGVVLLVVLFGECGTGGDVIEAYVGTIRAGGVVTALVGGSEADALTTTLRESTDLSIDNFQAQLGTACFWTSIQGPSETREVQFVLRAVGDGYEVQRASLVRGCQCPEYGDDQRCRLR